MAEEPFIVPKLEFDRFRAHVGPDWSCEFFDAVDGLSDDYRVVYPDDSLLVWDGDGPPSGIPCILEAGEPHCSLAWAIVRWRNTAGRRGTFARRQASENWL